MFQEATSAGKHLICDFKHIENKELLNNKNQLIALFKEICAQHQLVKGEVEK